MMAGRGGMGINDVAVPLTCAGKMAAFDPEIGLRPCDSMLVAIMPELKTNYDQLSRVAFQQSVGMHIVNLMTPLIGGLGGGAEGTAVVTVASHIMGAVCYSVAYHDMGHMSLRWSHNTDRMGLWIYALVGQAIARNTPMVTTNAIYTRSGLGTPEMLWEVAACAIACTPCGVHQMGIGTTGGKETDHTSGLEARFNAEVTHAALGLHRQEANDYVLKVPGVLRDNMDHPNPGKPFPELYNMDTVEPGEEWLDVYHQVRQKLIELGLDMDGGWKKVRKTFPQRSRSMICIHKLIAWQNGSNMHNNRLPEIVNRSENGPFIKEAAYDMTLARKTAELVKKHGIKFDPQVLVPCDDEMADRLYQAGLELFIEMGVYNQSTERRILFTREEVEAAVAAAPNAVILGCGKDAVIERHRDIESRIPCRMHSGPTGTPAANDSTHSSCKSCAQEPLVDCLGAGSVATYLGRLIISGSPTEILASRKEAPWRARLSGRLADRACTSKTLLFRSPAPVKWPHFDPELGLRPSDGLLVSQMPELKTNYDQLSRVAYMQSVGMHIVDLMTPLVGGLGGGAEGTAMVTVASHILGVLCYDVSYHFMGHMNLQWSHNTDRMGLWIQSMAGQALARNTPMVCGERPVHPFGIGYTGSHCGKWQPGQSSEQ